MTRAPQPDRAWLVLAGAGLCMFCGSPAVAYYTFGVFVSAVAADTHWSTATIAGAIGPATLLSAAMSPVIGRVCDRFGVRAITLVGGPAFALGLSLLGLLPHSARGFVGWTMVMFLLSFAGSPIPYAQALTGWFDRRRGLALGLMFGCGSVGIAFWPPAAAWLIHHVGWRQAYVVMGCAAGTMTLLAGLLLLRNPPLAGVGAATAPRLPGLGVAEAIRVAPFWKAAAAFMLLSGVLAGTAVNFPVILKLHGATPQTGASTVSVIGMTMLAGRLTLGLLLDRWFAPRLTIGITVVPMIGFALMMVSATKLAFFVAAGLLGFGLGSEYAVVAYLVSRAFGLRSFGAIYGLIQIATNIGAAVGPAAVGIAFARGAATSLVCSVAIAVLAAAVLILLTFRREDLPFGARAETVGPIGLVPVPS